MLQVADAKASKYPLVWDFSPLKVSDEDISAAQTACREFAAKWSQRTDYLSNPQVLLEALSEYEKLNRNHGQVGDSDYYWGLRHSQDQNDPAIKARLNQIESQKIQTFNSLQFFHLNLSKISPDTQKSFLDSPVLRPFRHYLERLFVAGGHLLSDSEEKILNLKSTSSHTNWVRMTSTFLSQETRAGKNLTQLMADLQSANRRLRDRSAGHIVSILSKYAPVAEHELNSILYDKQISDDLRGFARPDASRHLSDDIESATVDTMVSVVGSHYHLAHRLYKLKAKLLGVDRLKYHERLVPILNAQKKYSYDASVELVKTVLSDLDPEFARIFMSFVAHGQIDVYPRPGKRGGAFCAIDLMVQPTYILLNHTDSLRDVLTLAHEVGHGLNNELMKTSTNSLSFNSPLSTAEVASTFIEDFVLQKLMRPAAPRQKLALLIQKLDDDISTIIRQVAAYQFETELHNTFRLKGYLSAAEIGQMFQKHMAAYMGPFVEQSEGSQYYWVYWSHLRSFFYVYSYASGLLISKSLQAKVKADPASISLVKNFLSAGSSDSPQNLFARMGIDISRADFWQSGLNEIQLLLDQAEQLAKEVT